MIILISLIVACLATEVYGDTCRRDRCGVDHCVVSLPSVLRSENFGYFSIQMETAVPKDSVPYGAPPIPAELTAVVPTRFNTSGRTQCAIEATKLGPYNIDGRLREYIYVGGVPYPARVTHVNRQNGEFWVCTSTDNLVLTHTGRIILDPLGIGYNYDETGRTMLHSFDGEDGLQPHIDLLTEFSSLLPVQPPFGSPPMIASTVGTLGMTESLQLARCLRTDPIFNITSAFGNCRLSKGKLVVTTHKHSFIKPCGEECIVKVNTSGVLANCDTAVFIGQSSKVMMALRNGFTALYEPGTLRGFVDGHMQELQWVPSDFEFEKVKHMYHGFLALVEYSAFAAGAVIIAVLSGALYGVLVATKHASKLAIRVVDFVICIPLGTAILITRCVMTLTKLMLRHTDATLEDGGKAADVTPTAIWLSTGSLAMPRPNVRMAFAIFIIMMMFAPLVTAECQMVSRQNGVKTFRCTTNEEYLVRSSDGSAFPLKVEPGYRYFQDGKDFTSQVFPHGECLTLKCNEDSPTCSFADGVPGNSELTSINTWTTGALWWRTTHSESKYSRLCAKLPGSGGGNLALTVPMRGPYAHGDIDGGGTLNEAIWSIHKGLQMRMVPEQKHSRDMIVMNLEGKPMAFDPSSVPKGTHVIGLRSHICAIQSVLDKDRVSGFSCNSTWMLDYSQFPVGNPPLTCDVSRLANNSFDALDVSSLVGFGPDCSEASSDVSITVHDDCHRDCTCSSAQNRSSTGLLCDKPTLLDVDIQSWPKNAPVCGKTNLEAQFKCKSSLTERSFEVIAPDSMHIVSDTCGWTGLSMRVARVGSQTELITEGTPTNTGFFSVFCNSTPGTVFAVPCGPGELRHILTSVTGEVECQTPFKGGFLTTTGAITPAAAHPGNITPQVYATVKTGKKTKATLTPTSAPCIAMDFACVSHIMVNFVGGLLADVFEPSCRNKILSLAPTTGVVCNILQYAGQAMEVAMIGGAGYASWTTWKILRTKRE